MRRQETRGEKNKIGGMWQGEELRLACKREADRPRPDWCLFGDAPATRRSRWRG